MDPDLKKRLSENYDNFVKKYVTPIERECVGEGAYGVVWRTSEVHNHNILVAVKAFRTNEADSEIGEIWRDRGVPLDILREIALLKELHHDNITTLERVLQWQDADKNWSMYLVFKYCGLDLKEIFAQHQRREAAFEPVFVKSIMYQLISGIHYLHSNWVIHRDIKPANILVVYSGEEEGCVKIGDFGMARIFRSPISSLHKDGLVVTSWYRAPELLLGTLHYTPAIDMWSIGCIFAEFFTGGKPLFKGGEDVKHDELNEAQMRKVIEVVGSPSEADWPTLPSLRHWHTVSSWRSQPDCLRKIIQPSSSSEKAFDLMQKLLTLNPAKRITAEEALQHDYFKEEPLPNKNIFESHSKWYAERNIRRRNA